MNQEKGRKKRSDKKIDSKPTISINLKECIYRVSYVTNQPVKEIGEYICKSGISSRKVIEHLSDHFRRDFLFGNTFYMGDLNRTSLQRTKSKELTERITIRFSQPDYELIRSLAYSLDVTPSKATAILLQTSITKTNVVNRITKEYLKENLSESKVREFKKIIAYINQNNPYDEKISWASLLSYLYDELKEGATTMNKAINNWIDKNK